MNNQYMARVIALGSDIEEEVELEIQGVRLTCFASCMPFQVFLGHDYLVSIELKVFGALLVSSNMNREKAIRRIGDGLRHELLGVINGTSLDCGLVIEDELFAIDSQDRWISLSVDRIDAMFLSEVEANEPRRSSSIPPTSQDPQ